MNKIKTAVVAFLFAPAIAQADNINGVLDFNSTVSTEVIGLEMIGKGKIAKLWSFELSDGANAMLHGYAPHINDAVEFYVRSVDCETPDTKCNFELAIRKKEQP